ncbi:MAG: hypothetical protein PHS79_04960 [Patescibacteria group bacterium]|nr:hypothetical protein [Patescibacteria group bacterium]
MINLFEMPAQSPDRLPSSELVKLESLEAQKYFSRLSNALDTRVAESVKRSPERLRLLEQVKEEVESIQEELLRR